MSADERTVDPVERLAEAYMSWRLAETLAATATVPEIAQRWHESAAYWAESVAYWRLAVSL